MNSEKLKFVTTEISMDYLETFLEPTLYFSVSKCVEFNYS